MAKRRKTTAKRKTAPKRRRKVSSKSLRRISGGLPGQITQAPKM